MLSSNPVSITFDMSEYILQRFYGCMHREISSGLLVRLSIFHWTYVFNKPFDIAQRSSGECLSSWSLQRVGSIYLQTSLVNAQYLLAVESLTSYFRVLSFSFSMVSASQLPVKSTVDCKARMFRVAYLEILTIASFVLPYQPYSSKVLQTRELKCHNKMFLPSGNFSK